jgi:hypothetical protein
MENEKTFLFLIGKSNEVCALPFVFYNHKKRRAVSVVEKPARSA